MAQSLRTILFSARFLKPKNTYMACHNYIHDLKCKKLLIQEFGDPLKVVQSAVEEIHGPQDDEVLVQMLVASINPADINTIQGTYPVKPELPGVPGHEGVGKIVEIGKNVKNLTVGDMVIPNVENFGTWRSHTVVKADLLYKIPSNVPLVEVAGIASNTSTAYRMLKDFVDLQPGDSVIQNGGNSSAGQNVIQFCKAWGLKSINIVRNRPDIDKLKEHLSGLGATYVLTEEELRTTELIKSKEVPAPKLALNCVGGKSASELMRKLAPKGVIVTYGGMSREPVIIPTSLLIFKDITAKGYWMTRWTSVNRRSEVRRKMFDEIMDLMRCGKIKAPAHKLVPFESYKEALENTATSKGFAGVKYLLDFRNIVFGNVTRPMPVLY
ncbi:enoyl-[acyl-carrier-protein] reductase, mitochondrial [Halyomorpha halys]|uniref:enoyl-[acyl-carrier-protein] reductase, mitochondrial n=1 Tax=Halyomorpha halys TaxID=286706 RepID=UPI0006D51D83|nr:enoyl-[acyl-carrier-protein] reductase, mitochondrial [Halyomorpha halys]